MGSDKLFFLAFALLVLIFSPIAFAAPAPPQMIVNNATKECADFFAGDECMGCEIPQGWSSLGYMNITCPDGYAQIEVNLSCHGDKNEFCCSQGHSGAPGNCEDLLINDLTRQCALIDDASSCSPFSGWLKVNDFSGRPPECPTGYAWIEMKECPSGGIDSAGCCAPAIILCGLALMGFVIRK